MVIVVVATTWSCSWKLWWSMATTLQLVSGFCSQSKIRGFVDAQHVDLDWHNRWLHFHKYKMHCCPKLIDQCIVILIYIEKNKYFHSDLISDSTVLLNTCMEKSFFVQLTKENLVKPLSAIISICRNISGKYSNIFIKMMQMTEVCLGCPVACYLTLCHLCLHVTSRTNRIWKHLDLN